MSSGVYYYDKYKYGENRKIIAKCNISLYYSSYSTFIKKKEDNLNEIKLKKEKRNKEKRKQMKATIFFNIKLFTTPYIIYCWFSAYLRKP